MTPFIAGSTADPDLCGVLCPVDDGEEDGDIIIHGMDGAHTMSSASVMLPSLQRRFSFSSSPSVQLSIDDIATRFNRKSNGDDDWTTGLFVS